MRSTEDWPEGTTFDHDMYDGPIPCSDGDWIRLADYEAAHARIAELEAERDGNRAAESFDDGVCECLDEAECTCADKDAHTSQQACQPL